MFNLEKEILRWKSTLGRSGELEDGDIAELESHVRDEIRGYLGNGMGEETAFQKATEDSASNALLSEYGQARRPSGPPRIGLLPYIMPALIRNTLKVGWRNLQRRKGHSLLNIAGLALGFAVGLVITLYLIHDLTFDRFHEQVENIYRVVSVEAKPGTTSSLTSGPLVAALKKEIPDIRSATCIGGPSRIVINRPGLDDAPLDDPSIDEDLRDITPTSVLAEAIFTDGDFFKVFGFKILTGAEAGVLKKPGGVFLTPQIAEARFGKENPLGKPLSINGIENAFVAGIVEAPPSNSHIQFGAVAPLEFRMESRRWNSWESLGLTGYVLLNPKADPSAVNAKMRRVADEHPFPRIFMPRLQPLRDVHLGSTRHVNDDFNRGKNEASIVLIMGLIGAVILLIAGINFVNLSTARAATRAVEVGIRKVVGANRANLAVQFLGESVLTATLAFLAALIIVKTFLPSLEGVLHKELEINFAKNPLLILVLWIIAAIIGLLAGIFPALVLSSFKPINTLKGRFHTGRSGLRLRKILVVAQFAVTSSLAVGILFVIAQIRFLQSRDIGYNRNHVVVVPRGFQGNADLLKANIAAIPGVLSVGRVETETGFYFSRIEVFREEEGRTSGLRAVELDMDEGFLPTLEIEILKGRGFSKQFATDQTQAVMVNEAFVRRSGRGIDGLVGESLSFVRPDGKIFRKTVIGVTRDFHYLTARQALEPMVFHYRPQAPYLMIRIDPRDLSRSLDRIKEEGRKLYPHRPPRCYFFDKDFDIQFERDRIFARDIGILAIIGLLIACLGQIGLVSQTIEQRRREIAMRKIFGCSEGKIASSLSINLLKWVGLAGVLAWPCGYLAIRYWLNDFAIRVPLNVWPFLLALAGSLIIAFFTLSFQIIKAARANPADTLREAG